MEWLWNYNGNMIELSPRNHWIISELWFNYDRKPIESIQKHWIILEWWLHYHQMISELSFLCRWSIIQLSSTNYRIVTELPLNYHWNIIWKHWQRMKKHQHYWKHIKKKHRNQRHRGYQEQKAIVYLIVVELQCNYHGNIIELLLIIVESSLNHHWILIELSLNCHSKALEKHSNGLKNKWKAHHDQRDTVFWGYGGRSSERCVPSIYVTI